VAHRCSQDSLSTPEAQARFHWMVSCADKVPVIKEFLDEFATVKGKVGSEKYSLTSKGRVLYPTFMDHGTNPEKPWIAPQGNDDDDLHLHNLECDDQDHGDHKCDHRGRSCEHHGDCDVPSTVYVAAICVSSCATPEEQVIAQQAANDKLTGVTFIQALTKNYQFVGTLQSHSGMSAKLLQKTKVDQWVTELLDTEHQILEFHMKSGGMLKLTPNHPLVGDDAKLHEAADFKIGDHLIKLGGDRDQIMSISQIPYFGKVYNVFVKSSDPIKNIIVTNGYLNGTAFYQNEGVKQMNRVVFRQRLVKGVFDDTN
jgi:hypothetical protein